MPPIETKDCNNGDSVMVTKSAEGKWVKYKLEAGRIKRYTHPDITGYPITSSDVTITDLRFRVVGSTPYSVGSDLFQPQVIITISGFAGVKSTVKSSFSLETTVSQRMFDSP